VAAPIALRWYAESHDVDDELVDALAECWMRVANAGCALFPDQFPARKAVQSNRQVRKMADQAMATMISRLLAVHLPSGVGPQAAVRTLVAQVTRAGDASAMWWWDSRELSVESVIHLNRGINANMLGRTKQSRLRCIRARRYRDMTSAADHTAPEPDEREAPSTHCCMAPMDAQATTATAERR
jgi:hypothetical protein